MLRAFIRNPAGVAALCTVLALGVLAVAGPMIWAPAGARVDPAAAALSPSATHLLGTDQLGRDVLARTLAGTRLSLVLAILATAVAGVIGAGCGLLLSAIRRARMRSVAARVLDVVLAFPPIILAIFLSAVMGVGARSAAIAVGLALAPRFCRVTLTLAESISGRDFVAAARVLGLPRSRVVLRHVLPNAADTLLITGFMEVSGAILFISALSFLGLGVQPLDYDWGSLLTGGLTDMYTNPAAVLGPAAAIVVSGIAFGFLGEALAAAVNPTQWTHARRTSRSDRRERARTPTTTASSDTVLRVEGLRVTIPTGSGELHPVDGVSFSVRRGRVLGVVGESGSGKSMTVMALTGLTPYPARVEADRLEVVGRDLLRRRGRGGQEVAVVFQDPMNALNPALRISTQLTEGLRRHRGLSRREATLEALDALRSVHLSEPTRRMRQHPHELSGGMRQRVSIAMGLTMKPSLLLADEPTTALDVTLQAQVITLLRELGKDGMALVLVSHDVGVVAELCDDVVVMYAGRVVEQGPTEQLLSDPRHPYTRGLIASLPDLDDSSGQPLTGIPGVPYELGDQVEGCAFAPRCALATDECWTRAPELVTFAEGRSAACWVTAEPRREAEVAG
jgi:oligopeptide/dipeptide ABC transporter ATP-binding protein